MKNVKHRNRQVSLYILLATFFSFNLFGQYGPITQLPDFDSAVPITDYTKSTFLDVSTPLPDGQWWIGKKLENWDYFFETNEAVDFNVYYQKDGASPLILMISETRTEAIYDKINLVGIFYVTAATNDCFVISKYWRHLNGICQYQKFRCSNPDQLVRVDFEPGLNLVQTDPLHLEKQDANNAFISVRLLKRKTDWKLYFSSTEVTILDFIALEGYDSSFYANIQNGNLIVTFEDVNAISAELTAQQQLISTLKVTL